jgi:hypothetical protein
VPSRSSACRARDGNEPGVREREFRYRVTEALIPQGYCRLRLRYVTTASLGLPTTGLIVAEAGTMITRRRRIAGPRPQPFAGISASCLARALARMGARCDFAAPAIFPRRTRTVRGPAQPLRANRVVAGSLVARSARCGRRRAVRTTRAAPHDVDLPLQIDLLEGRSVPHRRRGVQRRKRNRRELLGGLPRDRANNRGDAGADAAPTSNDHRNAPDFTS